MILRALMLHFARHRAAVYQLRARHLLRARNLVGSQPRFVRGRPLDDPSTAGAPVASDVFDTLLAEGVPSDVIRESLAALDAPVERNQAAPPTEQHAPSILPKSQGGMARPPAITRPPVESRQREGRPANPAVPETPKVPGQRPTMDELRDVLLQLRAHRDPAPAEPAAPAEMAPAPTAPPRVRPSLGRRIEHVDHVVTDAALSTREQAEPTHADPAPVDYDTKQPAPPEHALGEQLPAPIAQPAQQERAPTAQAGEEPGADAESTHLARLDAAAPTAEAPMLPDEQRAALDHAVQPPLIAHDDQSKPLEQVLEASAQTTATPPDQKIDAQPENGVPIDRPSSEATAAPAALEPAPLLALEHTPPWPGIRASVPATPPELDHFDTTSLPTPDPSPMQAEQSDAITASPTHAGTSALRQDDPAAQVPALPSLPAAHTSDQLLAVPNAAGSAQRDGGPARVQATEQPEPVAHALAMPATVGQLEVSPPALETPAPETPAPMRMTTRRFLRPLLGFDPATTRIYRGPQAAQITTAHQAEAVTSGDQVALAAMHSGDTPQTLAVLAHELTHVARQRQPRFVPPIARIGVGAAFSGNEEHL
ncbi:MAG: DUF4157 domain-containing protein, partial [Chloroflexota bacterium]|nr:DUF4157 domain-containing protein [Chloroflexota bacterium]